MGDVRRRIPFCARRCGPPPYVGGYGLIHAVEHELEYGALAEIAGHLRARVVSAEFLLVDVFLEYVAEHVGVDFVGLAGGRVVEIPRVASKEIEDVLERAVGDEDARFVGEAVVKFDVVRQEQAAVEVADFSEQGAYVVTAGGFGFGESFKEQRVEEDRIEFIRAKFLAAEIELVGQVIRPPTRARRCRRRCGHTP